MATFTKILLSGSANGRGIPITATSSPGDTVHTSVSGTSDLDEIWIYTVNQSGSGAVIVIEFGGTDPSDDITVNMHNNVGMQLVIPGMLLNNSTVVSVYTSVGTGIIIQGFVNRITG